MTKINVTLTQDLVSACSCGLVSCDEYGDAGMGFAEGVTENGAKITVLTQADRGTVAGKGAVLSCELDSDTPDQVYYTPWKETN